jgi:hypothetical protein
MYSKEPVWLLPEQIVQKYEEFCFNNSITERRIVKLFDAHLLRGKENRHGHKVLVLQESFELLKGHVHYTSIKKISKQEAKVKRPTYLNCKYQIYYDSNKNWYTPKEILEIYSFLKHENRFNTELIGELYQVGLIFGKYQPSESSYHVSLSSFVDLLKYMNYTLAQSLILPQPPDNP